MTQEFKKRMELANKVNELAHWYVDQGKTDEAVKMGEIVDMLKMDYYEDARRENGI